MKGRRPQLVVDELVPYVLLLLLLFPPPHPFQERDAEKSRVNAERLASERSFYSELQRQEADSKSGGQRGMNPHKKKKGRQ